MRQLTFATTDDQPLVVLCVGSKRERIHLIRILDSPVVYHGQDYSALNADALTPMPSIVMTFLQAERFDVFDMATFLLDHSFTGVYCAVAYNIPKPDIITREVTSHFPGLSFDLMNLPHAAYARRLT